MYECPNCAGNLKFDIRLQKLFCEHCKSEMDPYSFEKDKDAEEREVFEVTSFHCPQCGGELLTEDTTAATFCSYCDSATILDSRISKKKRPTYIIPFKKTKEDCKTAFQKMMRRALFAPSELKDPEHIEKFRGIYMPYWIYSFRKHGTGYFVGKKETDVQQNNKQQVAHYHIQTNIDAEYQNLSFDASSTFSDSLSAAVGPFDLNEKKAFTPSYLSGFYADNFDMESKIYHAEAADIIKSSMKKPLENEKFWFAYDCDESFESANLLETMAPWDIQADLTMLPVWFLSYRKKDRVAYAIVNGQTGEAVADLPIDGSKIIKGALLLTLPLFVMFNWLFTLTPSRFLMICTLFAVLFTIVANNMTTDTLLKESCADYKLHKARRKETKRRKDKFFMVIFGGLYIILAVPFFIGGLGALFIYGHYTILFLLAIIGFIVYIGHDIYYLKKCKKDNTVNLDTYHTYWKTKMFTLAKPIGSILLSSIVIALNPIADEYYYITALICIGLILWCIRDVIQCHNLLCTRRLPQLNKRGAS